MEVETEVTVEGKVKCPSCGFEWEAEITDNVVIDVEPPERDEGD